MVLQAGKSCFGLLQSRNQPRAPLKIQSLAKTLQQPTPSSTCFTTGSSRLWRLEGVVASDGTATIGRVAAPTSRANPDEALPVRPAAVKRIEFESWRAPE